MRTKKLMLTVSALVLTMLMLVPFAGCQPTPDKPFVESKNDGELEQALHATSAPQGSYEAPENWTDTIESEGGITTVSVNATVTVPDVSAYPIYRVSNPSYTDEEALAFVHAMIGDEKLYTAENTRTKAIIEEEIKIIESSRYPDSKMSKALAAGELSQEEYDYYIEQDDQEIARLREEYKSAPIDLDLQEVELSLKPDMKFFYDYFKDDVVRLRGITAQKPYGYIDIVTKKTYPHSGWQYKHYSNNGEPDWLSGSAITIAGQAFAAMDDSSAKTEGLINNDMTYEQAKSYADSIVFDKLGRKDYGMRSVIAKPYYRRNDIDISEEYMFIYTPTIDGIPVLYYSMDSKGIDDYMWPEYTSATAVYIASHDEYEVYEQANTVLGEKLNDNVSLLSFDEVKDVFKKYITMNAHHKSSIIMEDEMESALINITDVRLGYVRMIEKDNVESGMLVPAWCFYGDETIKVKEEATGELMLDETREVQLTNDPGHSFLCINAIDGSIIDLDKGY